MRTSGANGSGDVDSKDWIVAYNPEMIKGGSKMMSLNLHKSFDHSSVVCCVSYSLDGEMLATGCKRQAFIYDAKSGDRLQFVDFLLLLLLLFCFSESNSSQHKNN